jgi:hypothetical protein
MANTGATTVTSAGTPVPLATSQIANCPVMIKAENGNTGLVYIMDPAAEPAEAMHLLKNEAMIFDFVGNLASIYVDAAVNGEGVRWALLNV